MGTKSGHLSGGKYTSSHTTVISAAVPPLEEAARLDCVSKISLGMIKRLHPAEPLLKFMDASPGCLLVKVRSRTALQEVWVYTSDKDTAIEAMKRAFSC